MNEIIARLNEQLWYSEHVLRSYHGRPGRVVRKAYPGLCDSGVESLGLYLTSNWSVEITTDRAVWIEAYASVKSCMQDLGPLVHQAYTPQGVCIAVLRDAEGVVIARALVNTRFFFVRTGEVECRVKTGYGEHWYVLSDVLACMTDIRQHQNWMTWQQASQIRLAKREVVETPAPMYDIVHRGFTTPEGDRYDHIWGEVGHATLRTSREVVYFRPYVDGHPTLRG